MVAPNEPYRNCAVNVFGTVHLLEAARQHEVAHFVYSSSQAAYGDATIEPITESTLFQPTTVYGATKGACDLLARSYRVQHGLNTTALRIGRVYGPGRRTGSLIFSMLDAAVSGRPLSLPASGGRRIQYVYDADIVSALYLALNAGKLPQPAYNVSGPGSYADEEIAAMVRSLFPAAVITFEKPGDRGETVVSAPIVYAQAQRDFGYQPQYEMAQGLAAYADWFRSRSHKGDS
jgi:UDP-glucose 4-epimerase